ncbi:MAG TPA: PqqD family peptide modification chaperone [Thiobacillus sp.]
MAADSLFSPNWHRVSTLHPRLGGHVIVQPQRSRDEPWYLLIDKAGGRQHRLNDIAYQFVGRCNGQNSTQEIWESLLDTLGDDVPGQEEIVRLIGQLAEAGLLQVEKASDVEALFERHEERRARIRRGALNPLSFRLPLFDPSALLRRLDGLGQLIFRPWALWLWLAVTGAATMSAFVHWNELRSHAALSMLTPRYLLLLWLCFPFIKGLHELAHGLAVRRWGGDVTQMGVTLLVLVPAPYVDASAASAFRPAYQRVMVSAAGIMAELLVAAAALAVWLNVEPGLVRDVAFVLMFIGSVSTVLFNGNPLLRFDGYYVLSDALDLPNLAPRSGRYWAYLIQRYLLGLPAPASIQPGKGERFWLAVYAPLSWAYRLFVSLLVAFWVAAKSVLLGLAAGLFMLVLLARPLYRALRFAFFSPALGTQRLRARLLASAGLVVAVVGVAVIPMPSKTVAEGVVWLPEKAQLRAGTDGFVVSLIAHDGERVQPGQLIARLEDPTLVARRQSLQSQYDSLRTQYYETLLNNPLKAQHAEQAMQKTGPELARVEERLAQLEVRAQTAGTLVLPRQADLAGTFMKRGELIGYVFSPDQVRIRAVVREEDIAQVRGRTQAVDALLAENPWRPLRAAMSREAPAATHTLPSPTLGDRAGGRQVTDPADKDGLQTLEPVFLVDLILPRDATRRVGGRAWVHFEHGAEPLAAQWSRRLRQLFLKHFSPAA